MKKLLLFLIIAIPLILIIVLNVATTVVTDIVSIPVEKVELSKSTMVTNLNETCSLSAIVYPTSAANKQIVWESSNPDIAVVDKEGNVSFSGFGSVYITATSLDSNKKASCYFVVTDTSVMQVFLYSIGNKTSVAVNESLQLQAQVFPAEALNKQITFSSSNPNILSVDENGLIKGVSVGNATIIAESDDSGDTASLEISVYQPVEDIILENNYILCEQSYCYVNYNILPANGARDKITYSTSDITIASVNKYGRVVFEKPGKIDICVMYENIKKVCQVEFTDGYVNEIIIPETTKTINYDEDSWLFEYNALPHNLYNTNIRFESSNDGVATVDDNGLVKLIGGGSCTVSVFANSSPTTILRKNVLLVVERDCTSIEVEQDIITAKPEYKLNLKTYPSDNTNVNYFYNSSSDVATVSAYGVVNFTQSGTTIITVIANSIDSSVKTTTSITFTDGMITQMSTQQNIELSVGEQHLLVSSYLPNDADNVDCIYTIISQQCKDTSSENVVSLNNNIITAVKGGVAIIKASALGYNNQTFEKEIVVNIKQQVAGLKIETDLENIDGVLVSGQQTVFFNTNILPADATEIALEFSVSDNNACKIYGNKIVFNYPATITLTAINTLNNIKTSADICFTTQLLQVEFNEMKTKIAIGESINISLNKYIPSTIAYEIILQKTNEKSNIKSSVIEISGSTITGKNGGTVEVLIYVSGIYRRSISLIVERLAQTISVNPSNIQITNSRLDLIPNILPKDTTNKSVIWQLDSDIATIDNNVLIFNDYGKVNITATVNDGSNVSIEFFIERVQTETQTIIPQSKDYEIYIGDYCQIDTSSFDSVSFAIISGNDNIITFTQDGLIYGLNAGNVVLKVTGYNQYGIIEKIYDMDISVYIPIENIILDENYFEFYNGQYYTALSNNQLKYNVEPTENIKNVVNFEIEDSTIAQIVDNDLIFYNSGTVILKASSFDGKCQKSWNITYTNGSAVEVEYDFNDVIVLQKNEQIELNIKKWIPFNTQNKNINISVLSQINEDIIDIDGNSITALSGGEINLLVNVSGTITKNINLIIEENITNLSFMEPKLEIASNIHKIGYIIQPLSATNKKILFSTSNENIATITNDGTITFLKAGKVDVTICSENDKTIKATCSVLCTMGYPNKLVLNRKNIVLKVDDVAQIYVSSFLPSDASILEVNYAIKSQNPIIKDDEVISISSNGLINALNGGSAVVEVYITNINNEKIFALCTIEVTRLITSFEIEFERSLEKIYDVYFTAQNTLDFNFSYLPLDATSTSYICTISDNQYAQLSNNTIKFLKEGLVTLTFTYVSNPSLKKQIQINYTNDVCVYAKLNEQHFSVLPDQSRQITLFTSNSFQFEMTQIIPNDIVAINYVSKLTSEQRQSSDLPVCEINGNTIKALNGGNAVYEVYINGYLIQTITIKVIRLCTSIDIPSQIFTAESIISLNPVVLPKDTTDTFLTYASNNTSIATVNTNGDIEFINTGSVDITITNPATGVYKNVNVTYTKQIKSLYFNDTISILSQGSTLLLKTNTIPANINDYELKFVSSDPNIATVTNNGRVITGTQSGYVTITAYLLNYNDVYVSRTFYVTKYVTNIALCLDAIDDDLGIKGERVFGTNFVSNGLLTNTYQMELFSVEPAGAETSYIWSSSDDNIATVNESGLVTFLKAGEVTIRVEPKEQYNILRPVYDSYTFKLVDAININSFADFMLANANKANIVFQNNITIEQHDMDNYKITNISFNKNIYGNGYLLSTFYKYENNDNLIVIGADGIIIDNLAIRGARYVEGTTLDNLTKEKVLVIVYYRHDVKFMNCLFENAFSHVRIMTGSAELSGCIFRNAGLSCVRIHHDANVKTQPVATINNCVFSKAMFCAVFFEFDTSNSNEYANKLIVKNNLFIYNFRKPTEMVCSLADQYVPGISSHLSEVIANADQFKYEYNGESYLNLGFLALKANYYFGSFASSWSYDMTQMKYPSPYSWFDVEGLIYGIDCSINVLSSTQMSTDLTPATTYDSTIYKIIREK